MSKDKLNTLSKTSVVLHWLVAITIMCLLGVGIYMEEFKAYGLYKIHKSVGILIFVVILGRVIWRLKQGWPEPVNKQHAHEMRLARISHWVLLIGSVLFPISGMLMSAMGGHGLPIFGFELLGPNIVNGERAPINADLASIGSSIHYWLGWIMLACIALHITGALKHHFVYKDGTLKRMLGKDIAE